MDCSAREITFHRSQNPKKVISQKGRFAAGEANFLSRGINKWNRRQNVVGNPTVVNVLGGLRAHQAVVIASFGEKKVVMKGVAPVEDPDRVVFRPQTQYVAISEIA